MESTHRGVPLRDPLAPIPPSRHPFQVWLLAATFVIGWVNLLLEPLNRFNKENPTPVVVMWGLLLVITSSATLASAWWKDRITGLQIERVALRYLGYGTMLYGIYLIYYFGSVATSNGGLSIGLGIACLWRRKHAGREILVLQRLIESRKDNGEGAA